jgi:hypothetical protein
MAALLLVAGLAIGAELLASPAAQGAAALQPSPTNTPNPASDAPPPAAHVILQTTLDTLEMLDTWRVEAEGDVTAKFRDLTVGVPVGYEGHFRAPDRLEGTGSTKLFGLTFKKDVVLLGRTMTVTTQGTGGGEAMARPAPMLSLLDFAGLDPSLIRDLTLVGEETLDGTPVYHLKGSLAAGPRQVTHGGASVQLQGQVQFDLWIGVADSLPRLITAEGKMTSSGTVPGSLHVVGRATFSEFGQPVVIEPEERPVAATGGQQCEAAGQGFVAYSHQAAAVRFCYPSGWVVDDVIDPCSCLAVSPRGVSPAVHVPDRIVLVYPPAIVAKSYGSPTDIAEVSGRTGLCTLQFFRSAFLRKGVRTVADLQKEVANLLANVVLRKEPFVGYVAGVDYDGAKAVAAGYLLDEQAQRPTIEAILSSIVPGP